MSRSRVWEKHSSHVYQEGLSHLTDAKAEAQEQGAGLLGAHGSCEQGRSGAWVSKIPGRLL